jgi:hypothetical protein
VRVKLSDKMYYSNLFRQIEGGCYGKRASINPWMLLSVDPLKIGVIKFFVCRELLLLISLRHDSGNLSKADHSLNMAINMAI